MQSVETESTLRRIVELANLVYSKEPHWGPREMTLMPPATEEEIEVLSKECPFPLPPSYIQFLQLHNGCLNFWLRYALLGTKGEPKEIVFAAIEDAQEFMNERIIDLYKGITPETIAQFEVPTSNMERLYLPNHTVFGANKRGAFLLFNEKEQTPDREYQVIGYTYDGGIDDRYSDFPSFLLSTVDKLEKRIKDKGYTEKPKKR
jgi:SMI1/KNR4 family protein SUKH-1